MCFISCFSVDALSAVSAIEINLIIIEVRAACTMQLPAATRFSSVITQTVPSECTRQELQSSVRVVIPLGQFYLRTLGLTGNCFLALHGVKSNSGLTFGLI